MFARSRGIVVGWVLCWLVCSLVGLGACSSASGSELLVVSSVGPTRLDDGTTLSVAGEGFPLGREGTLALRGTHQRPGEAPRRLERTLSVRVTSAEHAERTLDAETLRDLGGRGTFVGQAELAFDAARGGRVTGRVDTTLDLGGVAPPDEAASAGFRARLGLELDEELPLEGGLVVRAVEPGGLAASHGLLEGDRVVALGQLRLRSADELRAPRSAPTIVLHVERPGLEGTREVVLAGRVARTPRDPRFAIALALFAAVIVLFGPAGRALASLRLARARALPSLVVATLCASLASLVSLDLALVAAFVALPLLVDAWLSHRLRELPARWLALGAAFAVGAFLRVDGGAASTLALRHPLALGVVLATMLALAHRPSERRPNDASRTPPLAALAQGLGAVWIALLFFGSPWVGVVLALVVSTLPAIRLSRLVALTLFSTVASLALAFATDLSRPVPLTPDEPRVAWWIGAALASLVLLSQRRAPEPRAHAFL